MDVDARKHDTPEVLPWIPPGHFKMRRPLTLVFSDMKIFKWSFRFLILFVFIKDSLHSYKIPGQTIDKTSNRFAHKKGSIASRINEEVLAKTKHYSPEKKRKKGSSSFSQASKASSDSGVSSDPELSHRDGRERANNDDIDAGKYRDRDSRRRQDRFEKYEDDESEPEEDNRRNFSIRNKDSGSPERQRDSPGGQSIAFYDDGYEARRHQSWERREPQGASGKNSLDHSQYLSPRITNLNDSFSSSRPSRLESIPEAGQNIGA